VEIQRTVLAEIRRGRAAGQVVEDPHGTLWLVDLLDGRPCGRALIDDVGEVYVEEADPLWFVGGPVPDGTTRVTVEGLANVEVSVGSRAWVAAAAAAEREQRGEVVFAAGGALARRPLMLPAVGDPALRRWWRRDRRGRVTYAADGRAPTPPDEGGTLD
jgi:hypothetical protein